MPGSSKKIAGLITHYFGGNPRKSHPETRKLGFRDHQ
jgi:hypothetical protein